MKKAILFLSLIFLSRGVFSQNLDSLAVTKQVDSLIKISRELTANKNLEKAMELNAFAEKLALEKFGKESVAYGSCCFNHGRVLDYKRDYPEAEKWYLESKTILDKVVGKENPVYLKPITNLGLLYYNLGQYNRAEPFILEGKVIREKIFGKEHIEYVSSITFLANLYMAIGKDDKAEMFFLEAKTIYEKLLGPEHPDYARYSLGNLGLLYKNMGQYQKAEPLFLEARAIFLKVLGKEHPDYALSCENLAELYKYIGQYEKAELLYVEAKAIREKVFGKEHPTFAQNISSLASLYLEMGQYEKAEPFYQQALEIRLKVMGKEHPKYASSLLGIAGFYHHLGQYEKAEWYYSEAKDIFEKVYGREHPDYAGTLNNLGVLYYDMANYNKAEQLYQEALTIRGNQSGKEHPDYAASLTTLGNLYIEIGKYDKAEWAFLEAKTIYEKVLGKEHPEYARFSLGNLANLYMKMGQYEKAKLLFLETKTLLEKYLGQENAKYAESLNNLGYLYMEIGEYDKAQSSILKAKAIFEKVLGKEHPDYAASLKNLAILYNDKVEYDQAELFIRQIASNNIRQIEKAVHHLSEKEMNNYLNRFTQQQDYALSFSQRTKSKNIIPICFDDCLFYKGFLLNAANRLKHLAFTDSSSAEKYNQLKYCEHRLAIEYSKPIAERKGVAEFEEKANALEKDLVHTVAGYGEAMRQVNWKDVQSKLKEGEAAVEFVHYRYYDKRATDSTMYAALVLRKEVTAPVFVSLFEQGALDSLLQGQMERKADYVDHLYTLVGRGAMELQQPQRSLYELIWQPLEKELKEVKTVYYSPSGLLHRLNIGAIPIDVETTVADRYKLVALNSSRQLAIPTQIKIGNSDAVLYGGIKFEQDSAIQNNEPIIASRSRGELSFYTVDSTLRAGSWNYLPGTDLEVNAIEKIMRTTMVKPILKKGYAATEESFKNIGTNNSPSPRILHIATHGYFFSDPKSNNQKSVINSQSEPVFKISDHPMLRSGLILAGGNVSWQGKQPIEGKEDGILTAYEISQMNLSNTELVVLSACETGLGDIQGNEGVYGLQRAFKIAGAKYLIMSFWKVPDRQTSLLMTSFYKKWLEENKTIPDAFHAAQKELRDIGLDPYQWAGFVLVE